MAVTQIVVAAALFNSAGHVLVQRRRSGAQHGGLWEFPGGKVEEGEALAAALVREIEEELGVSIDGDAMVPIGFSEGATDHGRLLLLLYRCNAWSGDAQCLDAEEIAWVEPAQLSALAMPPADVPLVAALLRSLGL